MTEARHTRGPSPVPAGVPGVAIRAAAVILDRQDICLIRRHRPQGDHYSVPGGIARQGEETPAALARELSEELGLDLAAVPESPRLRWVQNQILTRPGSLSPFRRRHLIYVIHLPTHLRPTLAPWERDDPEQSRIIWIDYQQATGLHLYPAISGALSTFPALSSPTGPLLLPAMTDQTYSWR